MTILELKQLVEDTITKYGSGIRVACYVNYLLLEV